MEPDDGPLSIRVLDRVGVEHAGRFATPSAPKFRQVLALLAFRAGQVVPVHTLVDELWPCDPPKTAVTTTQTYVYGLRRMVDDLAGAGAGKATIVTHRPGYLLDVPRDRIDVFRFRDRVAEARRDASADRRMAIRRLRCAHEMVPATPLPDVPYGPVLAGHAEQIAEEVLAVRRTCVELEIEAGDPAAVLGELRMLVASHPLREEFVLHLMQVLHRVNRRADALAVFRTLREDLARELGLEPCPELQHLHRDILAAPGAVEVARPRTAELRSARPA